MNIVLWVLQVLLGLMFLLAGFMKASQSNEKIKESGGERMAWVDSLTDGQVTIIGVLELLAGIGLILPMLTGILPILTPFAAVGLVLTMIGAAALHIIPAQTGKIAIITGASAGIGRDNKHSH